MLFFYSIGQERALEVALEAPDPNEPFDPDAAKRFLLSPGDQIEVPANNVYRLENRSTTDACRLFFCFTKAVSQGDDEG